MNIHCSTEYPIVRIASVPGYFTNRTRPNIHYRAPKAGFGNRILSYLSLVSISRRVGCHVQLSGAPEIHTRGWTQTLRRRSKRLSRFMPLNDHLDFDDPVVSMEQLLEACPRPRLEGALLGDVWVRVGVEHPSEILNVESWTCSERPLSENKRIVAMHFRGGDFGMWNPQAILSLTYYAESLEYIRTALPDALVVVVTDDWSLPSVAKTLLELSASELRWSQHKCSMGLKCDFSLLRAADLVVSSPSTFAIAAGMLGTGRSIHSSEWVQDRAERGDRFWVSLLAGSVPHYTAEYFI